MEIRRSLRHGIISAGARARNIADSAARCRRASECSFVRERLTGQAARSCTHCWAIRSLKVFVLHGKSCPCHPHDEESLFRARARSSPAVTSTSISNRCARGASCAVRLCPRRIYLTRAYILRRTSSRVIAPARIGDSRASADNTLSSAAGCVWNRLPPEGRAPDTDGYDISEVRGDLRFSRPFIPILFALLLLSFSRGRYSCRYFAAPPFLFPTGFGIHSRQSFFSLAPLLFFFSSSSFSRPRVSLIRFVSPPRCHPNAAYIDSSQRLEKEERMKERKKESFLFLCLPTNHTFICLRALFERAKEQDSRNAFSKLKTGLSASTFGPTANSTVKLNHTSNFKF